MLLEFKNMTEHDSIMHDLYVLVTYIPPSGSAYVNRDIFCELEDMLLYVNAEVVLVVGDLNARTKCMKDYVDDMDAGEIRNECCVSGVMESLGIVKHRISQDDSINSLVIL